MTEKLLPLRAAATQRLGAVRRVAPYTPLEVRDSGSGAGAYTIKGHAAVFNRPCDFRAFKEYIAPGAFDAALGIKPLEVVSNWQHDDRWILGHTLNKTLEMTQDDEGLMQWTQVAPTSYAADLRILLERGDIQQQSFCFIIGAETWDYVNEGEDDEEIKVTITEVKCLYDVTVCALGAYPQTDVSLSSRARLGEAVRAGLVPNLNLDSAVERGFLSRDALEHDGRFREDAEGPKPSHLETEVGGSRKARRDRELAIARAKARKVG